MTPEQMQAFRWEKELDERNRPLTDYELDGLFPKEGYKVNCCIILHYLTLPDFITECYAYL